MGIPLWLRAKGAHYEVFLILYGAAEGRAGFWNDEKGLSTAYVVEFNVAIVPIPAASWLFGSGQYGKIQESVAAVHQVKMLAYKN